MTGTSPFTLQSPSYHSSSYLPKLEANFMRDFSCCGVTLPSLHDLLQHYEEAHAQKPPQHPQRTAQSGHISIPDNRAVSGGVRPQTQQNQPSVTAPSQGRGISSPRPVENQRGPSHLPPPSQQHSQAQTVGFGPPQANDLPDLDTVDDMEMDDPLDADESSQLFPQPQSRGPMQARFGQQNPGRVTPLNLGL